MNESAGARSTSSPVRRLVGLLPKQDWIVIGWVLAIKLLLFVFGAKSYQILENKRLSGAHAWFDIWNRWDGLHYQSIAQFGYGTKHSVHLVFYPLYPWCVRFLAQLSGDYLVSAFVVSGAASIAAAVLLRRLVQLDYPTAIALRSAWFFLIFPTAYFLHIGFSESLFIALALGSLFAARRERWWLAGVAGACCWMTRPTGLALFPTLAVEAAYQFWITKRINWRWLWIALVPAGFVVYLLVNWHSAGDPFAFLQRRKEWFAISFSWPWVGIRSAIGNLDRDPSDAEIVGAQELTFVLLGLIALVASWIKLRPSYAMWISGNWMLFVCATFIGSAPRYTLTMFPIFILFALITRGPFAKGVLTAWSIFFFALFTSLFVRGWWAF